MALIEGAAMGDLFLLSERQMARMSPSFPISHGVPRVVPRRIGRTKGGLNWKLHTVCDGEGRPIILLLSEGQMSDHKGAPSRARRLACGRTPDR